MNTNKEKNNYSIILMKDNQSPKHFNVNKKQIKLVLIAAPSLLLISLMIISFFVIYFSNIKMNLVSEKTKLTTSFEVKIEQMQQQLEKIDSQNIELKEKLIFSNNTPLKTLEIIKTISGASDLRSEQLVEVDQLKASMNNNKKLNITFKLSNQSKKTRMTGFFHLALSDKYSTSFYPGSKTNSSNLRFDEGEYFSTARFRPVSIHFEKFARSIHPTYKLTINIFAINGDLIYSNTVNLQEIFNER